jgi:catechol 2,3-dioxygenase-like lactoylglutathione lyase family enzyme
VGLNRLHHIVIGTPHLEETEKFATDFGMFVAAKSGGKTYFRTGGGDAYCYVIEPSASPCLVRLAFLVDSINDLERATSLEGATPISSLDGPADGKVVSVQGPYGLRVDLVHGIPEGKASETSPALVNNFGREKVRQGLPQHTRPAAPAELFRIGHIGLFTPDVPQMRKWLMDVLGLVPTDEMYMGTPSNLICSFMRIDQGEHWVDHHTIAVFKGGPKLDLHHASFEVADYEAQFMAHRYMQTKGWELIWGVGRHPLGSHVFDLWRDPNRYRFETFSDTDLANSNTPTNLHDAMKQEMDRWSPPGSPDRYFA